MLDSENDPAVLLAVLKAASTVHHGDQYRPRIANLPPRLQVPALNALGRVGATSHSDVVVALIGSGNIPVRAAAIAALGTMKDTAHAALVIGLLNDPHPTVRRAALESLQGVALADMRQDKYAQAALSEATTRCGYRPAICWR